MRKKYTIEEICAFSKEELNTKLKETYQNQKLSPKGRVIARSIEIIFGFVVLLTLVLNGEILYAILVLLGVLYAIYRLFKPHGEDKEILEKLDMVSEGIDQFKKYKNGEIKLNLEEKQVKSLEKNIVVRLPFLLSGSKFDKIAAFIPLVNLRTDELNVYTANSGVLNVLLSGYIKATGLNEIIKK